MRKHQDTSAGDAEKKRRQNRIAQQSSRSRQNAYVRNLEALVEAVKVKCNEDDASKYSKLLKAHLQLIEEKRELEDAFLRLRQRLLSIGNMSVTAADSGPTDSTPTAQSPHSINEAATAGLLPQRMGPLHADTGVGQANEPELTHPTIAHHHTPASAQNGLFVPEIHWSADTGDTVPDQSIDLQAMTPTPGLVTMQARIPRPIFETYTSNTGTISNAAIFAQQVYFAASKVLTGASTNSLILPIGYKQSPHPPGDLVNEIASSAVEVIGSLAGLNTYIYGVRFANCMEQVLRWRLTNDQEVRMAISEPFRPTTLQRKTPTHPVVIDFINWPSIRDQMILMSNKIDLDAMCRDLVLNTVVEIPHRQIAVRVHDVLFQHVLPRIQGCSTHGEISMLFNSKWIYLTIPSSSQGPRHGTASPIEDALAMEIANRIQRRSNGAPTVQDVNSMLPIPGAMGLSTGSVLTTLLPGMLNDFGIGRIETWKVSHDFARKYPYINCSSVISAYEMVPCPVDLGTTESCSDPPSWEEISF
ncbi:hypothetical protein PFICI_02356 [Pestalotiopsis fici W106-1]|uniref:BZIP domain-containing protein n=1 Tax=Pestalotiopsis fici (strain W106-1 / CGMCC3.15140) TaxID=1229662 RepID=W3XGK5_PESFW|nr:uncharacterized protein PFICI_02356 [Pestalotiopsis fici W106-1]ETS84331.1 hypothetical protein PFICI_02356 [Pestalotiopsis fici W106-1]